MRMMPIASGSSGNCIYIGSDDTHILIDAGISRKKIEEGLNSIDVSLKDIDAVFVTHEHIDHNKRTWRNVKKRWNTNIFNRRNN